MNAPIDSLRNGLADLAGQVRDVDLRDRVLRTSRRLAVRRAVMTSTAVVAVLAAASGVALAMLPQRATTPPPVAGTTGATSPGTSPSTSPSASPSAPAAADTAKILPGRLLYQTYIDGLQIHAWDGTSVRKVLQPADASMPFMARISPDGQQFVWITRANQLYLADADGSGARKVRDNVAGECVEPVWTADSRRVLVNTFRLVDGIVQDSRLGYLELDSGVFRSIGEFPGCHFILSPGGDHLAYVDGSYGKVTIARADGTDSRIVPLLGENPPDINGPGARTFDIHSLSPDGNLLTCNLNTHGIPVGDVALGMSSNAVIDTRTGKQVALPVNGEMINGVFLADGSLLARIKGPARNQLVLISNDWKVLDRVDEPAESKDLWLLDYFPA